jgi:uncharacterized membrane protein
VRAKRGTSLNGTCRLQEEEAIKSEPHVIVLLVLLAFAIAAVVFTIVVVVVVDRSTGDTQTENREGPVGGGPGEEQRD